jgi:hypothetical protein
MPALIGGEKLQHVLAEIGSSMEGSVSVGFLGGATYPDGTNVAQVAFWNEFGTARIPPRPFFRTMIANESPGWGVLMQKAAKHYDYSGKAVLKFMGEKITEQLQSSITGWQTPPNAPSTIAKKGFNNPLSDTNHMHDSVGCEVDINET